MKGLLVQHPEDVGELPARWRTVAVKALMAIRDCPEHPDGFDVEILVKKPGNVNLDLSGCLALRFGSGAVYDDSFRVVYRLLETGAEVLAVGRRQGSEVYRVAQDRLRPPAPIRRVRPAHNVNRREAHA